MATFNLSQLLSTIHKAVSDAANISRDKNIQDIEQFFDTNDDGTISPKMLKLKMGDTVSEVPLFTLAQHGSVCIDELKMSFNIEMSETQDDVVNVQLSSDSDSRQSISRATVEIKFKGNSPTEGLMRINDRLVYQIPK